MRLSFLWILLGLSLLAPAVAAQDEALYGDIVVSEDEAFLDLAADFDTTWELLLNHWGDESLSWPQQALPETWVVVEDLWVRLEGLPYRSGTWTRVRVRVGDFQGTDEKGRAEALLYQLAVDLETLRELEQAAARELAANLASTAVGYDAAATIARDPAAPYGAGYPWIPYGLMFSPEWLFWGWPSYYGYGSYPLVYNNYYDSYWHHGHHYGDYFDYGYGWGGYWWDYGCGGNGSGAGNGGGNGGDGDGGGGGGGNGDKPLNPPIIRWDGVNLAGNLPGLTGSFGGRGIGGSGGSDDTGSKGAGPLGRTGGAGSKGGPVTVSPGRSIVVRTSSTTTARRSVAMKPLPLGGSTGLGIIHTSGFGNSGILGGRGGSAGFTTTGSYGGGSSGNAPSRTIPIAPSRGPSSSAGSSSRPSPSPGLSSVARVPSPSVASRPPTRVTPSYVPSRSPTFRGFGASASIAPSWVRSPRAAPSRSAPSRATPSRSAPSPRASSSRSSSSRSASSSRARGSSSRSSGRSSGSSGRSSSSRSSSSRSSGRGGA